MGKKRIIGETIGCLEGKVKNDGEEGGKRAICVDFRWKMVERCEGLDYFWTWRVSRNGGERK